LAHARVTNGLWGRLPEPSVHAVLACRHLPKQQSHRAGQSVLVHALARTSFDRQTHREKCRSKRRLTQGTEVDTAVVK